MNTSRRSFLKASIIGTGAIMAAGPFIQAAQPGTRRTLKVALIGCGGRGRGALSDHINAAKFLNERLGWELEVKPIAAADWFRSRALEAGKQFGISDEFCFGGPTAYKKVLELKPDVVLMAEAPVFRPVHFEAAITAGVHVFFEKPVAVDPPGVRRVIAAGEIAGKKGLCVVAGTQRRHDRGYNQMAREIKDGVYGRILGGRVSWCQGAIFTNTPQNPQTADDLIRNWQIWVELSGDHMVEQHVHNIDIANWYLDSHPIAAVGFGFRARRKAGNMYDFFSVDFEYPNGVHIHSMCRQMPGCWNWVGEQFTFEKEKPAGYKPQSPDPYEKPGYHDNPYIGEHAHLLYAIVTEHPINEARQVALATGAAIMGRESAYTGKRITWKEMFEDPTANPALYNLTLRPTAEDFESGEVKMLKDGDIRVPGNAW